MGREQVRAISTPRPVARSVRGIATAARRARLGAFARRYWVAILIVALYAAAAFVVPTLTPAAVSDDWVYVRSVEILVRQGKLKIIDLSVVTLLSQIAWGALFALPLGPSFGALRIATLVLVALGGVALYALCRELRIGRAGSALALAAYLFHPLSFVLAYSFMSDPQFTALITIASYGYVRGLRPGAIGARATLFGSAIAALAFLMRQQGALLPLAVLTYLALCRRPRGLRETLATGARVGALPALAIVLYYLWLKFINGIPFRQGDFVNSIREAGLLGTRDLTLRLLTIEALYLGFFALPLAVALLPRLARLCRFAGPRGWLLFAGWVAIVAAGVATFGAQGRLMPYVAQFVGTTGLGPDDLLGQRPPLVGPDAQWWFTAACAAGALLLGLALCRRAATPAAPATPDRARAGLTLTIALWQAVGILPASYSFQWTGGSLDRYLLPLLPFALGLGLWALRDLRPVLPLAWAVVIVGALLAIAGTRDFLVFQGAIWDFARHANALGIDNTRLDAGPPWDGYHLYEYSQANHISPRTPGDRPWWTGLFAPATDSSYVISSTPLSDYTIVEEVAYPSWLHRAAIPLYLLRRPDVAGPP
jgi:hypothetical protein